MRWFRKHKRDQEEAPKEAAASGAREEAQQEQAADRPERKPARRRGTRGGRGRGKKKTEGGATSTAVVEGKTPEKSTSEKPKPARQRRSRTDRKPVSARARSVRADLNKEIFVSVGVGESRVAVLEDSQVVEVYLDRPGRRTVAGNVYKGVVDNVLPGMEASFVDIGLEKNGFLYVDEIIVPELEGKRHGRKIQDLVQRGQEVTVQAVKDPMGTKGARLTTEISLPGRFLVYVPFGDGIGVSRRLDDPERERLKAICKELDLGEGGLIVRTAAEGASKEELSGDLALLRKLWSTINGRASRAEAPALIYQESEMPLRIIRDLFIRDFERVVVDHDRTFRRIVGYLKRTSPELAAKVERYQEREPLMERYGVDQAIRSTLDRRVDLPSGGYLIFDYAEAFTVVDVNTGRFVGARGKAGGARLEDTITKNNLEAVVEVVRQLRLRDIGGIIVIDFIDMANPKNRQHVEDALNNELARDRTKTYVVEISPLGLVEMTRQNVTDGPREILTETCKTCDGNGVVVSDETHAVEIERQLRKLVGRSDSEAFLVELNAKVASIFIGPGASRLEELEAETGRHFGVKTRPRVNPSHFTVLKEGRASEIDPEAFPVSAGQELDVELLEAHKHEDRDAIARLDGYVVTVRDAAGRVGEKAKVRIERVTRTSAQAVLADGVAPAVVQAPREGSAASEPAAAEEEAGEQPAEDKPKKRTRRGSRGGRGRKKKPAAQVASEPVPAAGEDGAGTAAQGERPKAAAGENGAEPTEEKPKKKTRRGSRGGRGRKKKPAAPASDPLAEAGDPG